MRPRKHKRIGFIAAATRAVRRLKRAGQERAALEQLLGLAEHTLRDIGISRTDILFIAAGTPPRRD